MSVKHRQAVQWGGYYVRQYRKDDVACITRRHRNHSLCIYRNSSHYDYRGLGHSVTVVDSGDTRRICQVNRISGASRGIRHRYLYIL